MNTPHRHGRLQGIYNESPRWRDVFAAAVILGIPFSLGVAFLSTIFR